MKNLSDYIPLLIILASIVFSFVKKPKKKEVTKNSVPNAKPVSVPTVPDNKSKTYQTASVEWKEKLDTVKKSNAEKGKTTSSIQIKNKTFSHPALSDTAPVVLTEENPEPFINVSDMDEVKKAIIYAEIFTRKEY